ncbi:MAG: NAD(P)H-hydrate dehydratase [Gammaproteobacteria bacterium]|nr:NAD(P)H-hydrate dehydratase [Gammaproteobacteria bacterium]
MSETSLPLTLYTAEQVRELDRIAIEEKAIPGLILMQRAAQATFEILKASWHDATHVLICCGSGNNGGDGYLLACIANKSGYKVTVLAASDEKTLTGDARSACEKWQQESGETIDQEQLLVTLDKVDLVVDALLGTGLTREVSGPWAVLIETINQSGKPVLSVDIPSGLNADTGQVMGVAVRASKTISYIGLKRGMYTACGRDFCGDIYFNNLDVPGEIYGQVKPSCEVIDPACVQQQFQKRLASTHKGQCGHVLLIGGDTGMAGAIQMSAEAAARSGAGLVSIATRSEHATEITIQRPELMCHGVESASDLEKLIKQANVVAIGPGLGQSKWAQDLLQRVMESDLPLVVDADALNLLASHSTKRTNWVLTPHPGEAARLLNCGTAEMQHDRFASVKSIAQQYNAVVVLKGSGSLVFDHNTQNCFLCRDGNPGMATGGMGDILTGVIAALIAQGLTLIDAACCGTQCHAHAADRAAESGERGMMATDLLPFIRQILNEN